MISSTSDCDQMAAILYDQPWSQLRRKLIRFGSITSFLVSIMYYFALFNGKELSTLGNVLLSIATITVSFGFTCYKAAIHFL